MTIARDASSPARFNLSSTTAATGTESGTSASFTPPANAWIYCSACINNVAGATPTFSVPTNTGGGLSSWTLVKSQNNAAGGSSAVWRAFVNSSVATTVTVSVTTTGAPATQTNDSAAWVDVWTGAATSQTGAATAGGTSTTVNFSPTITTTASGSQVAGVAIDWAAAGTPTSTDTIDGYTQTGQTSGGRAYKGSNSGAAGSVALNFHSPGTPQWAYALYEILAPAGSGTSVNITGQAITSTKGTVTSSLAYSPTGQSITSTEGTPTPTVAYAVTGQSITSTLGTITPSITYALLGQAITSVLGSIVPTVSYDLTGQTVTFTEGTISASVGSNVSVSLTGQQITSTLGTITPVITYSVVGQSLASTEGAIAPGVDYAIVGQSIISTEGAITSAVSGDVTLQLTGLIINSTLGSITITGADQPVQPPSPTGSVPGKPVGKKKRRRDSGPYMRDDQVFGEEYAIATRDSPGTSQPKQAKADPPRASRADRSAVIRAMLRELL